MYYVELLVSDDSESESEYVLSESQVDSATEELSTVDGVADA